MSLVIREGVPDDIPALARAHLEAWEAAYRGQIPDAFIDAITLEQRQEGWRKHFEDDRATVMVVEGDDALQGFAAFGPVEDDPEAPAGTGEVYAIYLLPTVIGVGIGRALFAQAGAALREEGFKRAVLWVLETNDRARRFYEKAGWVWDGTTSTHRFDCAEQPVVRYAIDL